MFSLLYGCWQYAFTKREYYTLVIGLDGAGKTTLIEHTKSIYQDVRPMAPEKISPTVGLNLARVETGHCTLVCWDVGGQTALQSMWERYYGDAHAVVFVVDAADITRLDEARETLERVLRNPNLQEVPILVLFNKMDLDDANSEDILINHFHLDDVTSHKVQVQSIVAAEGIGIEDAWSWLVDHLQHSARRITPSS